MDAVLHALGTPRRREILRLLWDDERSAGDVHRAQGDVTFGAVSQHLRVLARAGAVAERREGRRRLYRARREALGSFASWLESTWDDALYRLKLQAELEEARRGPRAGGATRKRARRATGAPSRAARGRERSRARRRRGRGREEA